MPLTSFFDEGAGWQGRACSHLNPSTLMLGRTLVAYGARLCGWLIRVTAARNGCPLIACLLACMLVVVLLLPLLGRERAVGMKASSPDRKCKRDVAIPTDFFFSATRLCFRSRRATRCGRDLILA